MARFGPTRGEPRPHRLHRSSPARTDLPSSNHTAPAAKRRKIPAHGASRG